MNYLLDTNIILHLIRRSSHENAIRNLINNPSSLIAYSIVSLGELEAIALRNKHGIKKIEDLKKILHEFVRIDLVFDELPLVYAELQVFSQGKLKSKPISQKSAINLPQNDLWIAACTCLTKSTLITCDKHFDHFHGVYFDVIKP